MVIKQNIQNTILSAARPVLPLVELRSDDQILDADWWRLVPFRLSDFFTAGGTVAGNALLGKVSKTSDIDLK